MIRILIFISALLFFIPFANAEDIFNGTILFKNNDWHFVRCSITQDDYLIEAPQEIFTQFKELQQQQKNYWVSVLAEVNEQQNGNLILKIEKIDEVIYAELSGDFPLGDSRQPIYKSLQPFDLVS